MTSSETSTLPKSYAILQSMQFTPRFSINAPSTLHHRSTKKFTSNSWSINGNFRFSQKKSQKICKTQNVLISLRSNDYLPSPAFFCSKNLEKGKCSSYLCRRIREMDRACKRNVRDGREMVARKQRIQSVTTQRKEKYDSRSYYTHRYAERTA